MLARVMLLRDGLTLHFLNFRIKRQLQARKRVGSMQALRRFMQLDVHGFDLVATAPLAAHESAGALLLVVRPRRREPNDLLATQGAVNVPIPAVELQVVLHEVLWHLHLTRPQGTTSTIHTQRQTNSRQGIPVLRTIKH